jgi:hypothetical protein
MGHRFLDAAREFEATLFEVALDDLLKLGLVYGYLTFPQAFYLLGVDIHADHVVSRFRETGPAYEPDVADPYDRNTHV